MKYDLLIWLHEEVETDPNLIILEYNKHGSVPRVIEIYRTGDIVLVQPHPNMLSVVFSEYPSADEEDEDKDCITFEITKPEFDKWLKKSLAPSSGEQCASRDKGSITIPIRDPQLVAFKRGLIPHRLLA